MTIIVILALFLIISVAGNIVLYLAAEFIVKQFDVALKESSLNHEEKEEIINRLKNNINKKRK